MHNRLLACSLLVAAALSSGCIDLNAACTGIGICDPPAPRPLAIDVICDSSLGSTCTRGSISDTFEAVLPVVADKPGNVVPSRALEGVGVVFSFVGVPPVDGRRCDATIERARGIEAIWSGLVRSSGGTVLQYSDNVIDPRTISVE